MPRHHFPILLAILLGFGTISGCNPFSNKPAASGTSTTPDTGDGQPPARVQMVRFIDPVRPIGVNPPIMLAAARNETVHFAIQINNPPKNASRKGYALQLSPIKQAGGSGTIPLASTTAAQVVPLPIDVNRAGFVRYSGLNAEESMLPRAMVPLELNNGTMELAQLRKVAGPPIVWFDIQIPPTIAPGNYESICELIEDGHTSFSAPVKIHVEDFVLPDERHLALVGAVEWDSLARHWPGLFANIPPRLLSRKDEKQIPAIKLLDEMVRVAHAHRLDLVVPRMQPTVKWLGGKPIIDWTDFDSLVAGWLKGTGFADAVPSGYWPLPVMDKLEEYTADQQRLYWAEVASHFDQLDWLARASAPISRRGFGRIGLDESYALSTAAAQVLAAHARIRVSVPLEEEQVRLAGSDTAGRIQPDQLDRLLVSADPLVFTASLQKLPPAVGRWLRADLPGLVPSVGAGADERQTRLWAMLAFLRNARLVQWNSVLPGQTSADIPADPDETVWFYPGEWFGVSQPVPSIQLKWLRRAQQDFEYLWLARQREQGDRAANIARLLVKPVELQPGQNADAIYGLMSASADPKAWDQAVDLLSRTIQLSKPGQKTDPATERQLTYDLATWTQSQARPILVPRSAEWTLSPAGVKNSVALKLGIDIYNPAELHPEANRLQWNGVPESWAVSPAPVDVPRSAAFSVGRFNIEAAVDLASVVPGKATPAKLLFIEGYSKQSYPMSVVLPVSFSEQRQGAEPVLDGSLNDWMGEDILFQGRMVKLIDRPALQAQRLDLAATESAIYSTWTPQRLYLAFRLDGADAAITNAERSFVERQFGRAWGEDIAEIVLQPIFASGAGPLFHLAFKPRGQLEVFRRLDPRLNVNPWQAFGSTDIRYATNVTNAVWRGEVMIPWDSLLPPGKTGERPLLLRMNFLQHRGRTGESASWAGPVDLVREDPLMGLVQVRKTEAKGFVPNR